MIIDYNCNEALNSEITFVYMWTHVYMYICEHMIYSLLSIDLILGIGLLTSL